MEGTKSESSVPFLLICIAVTRIVLKLFTDGSSLTNSSTSVSVIQSLHVVEYKLSHESSPTGAELFLTLAAALRSPSCGLHGLDVAIPMERYKPSTVTTYVIQLRPLSGKFRKRLTSFLLVDTGCGFKRTPTHSGISRN